MLYDARIQMRLPGDSKEDAIKRLASKLPPGWSFEVDLIEEAYQPKEIFRGVANIKLPELATRGR